MHTKPSRLFTALLLIGLPLSAMAQSSVIVPPPVQPGTQPVAAAASPVVSPPASVTSVNPAQGAQPGLIDVALPAAPVAELRPSPPAQPETTAKVAGKSTRKSKSDVTEKSAVAKISLPEDPFAALVGTPVSDSQLNRFVFPESIAGVYFSEGAPLPECPENAAAADPCKPVFLNDRKMMLLQLRAGAKGPVQMLVHLHSGRVVTLNLTPTAGPGAVVRIDGAEDGASDARLAAGRAKGGAAAATQDASLHASEQNIALLSRVARGDIPDGFEVVPAGPPVRFDYFDVIPMASWSNGAGLVAHLMQVKAFGETPVAINAALFRTENVKALALDRETITEQAPAMLYLLEALPEGAY